MAKKSDDLGVLKIHVKLEGLAPFKRNGVMHTRMPRPDMYKVGEIPASINYKHVENLLHYEQEEKRFLAIPSDMIEAFFTKERNGAIARYEGRAGKALANKALAKMFVTPEFPLLTRNGAKIEPTGFNEKGLDMKAGLYAAIDKPLVKGGFVIAVRPVVMLPWDVEFDLQIHCDAEINEHKVEAWLKKGGIEIGIGSHRPKFGRFNVTRFEVENI